MEPTPVKTNQWLIGALAAAILVVLLAYFGLKSSPDTPVPAPSPTVSASPSPFPSVSPTPSPSSSPSPLPSATPTPSPSVSASPTPKPTPSASASPKPSPTPTALSWVIPTTQEQWTVPYNGFGFVSFDAVKGVTLSPMAATAANETHAALALSKIPLLKNFKLSLSFVTEAQLRSPTPNLWESAWLFFNYTVDAAGKKKANYLAMKPNGYEVGTAFDELGQTFLWTSTASVAKIGQVYKLDLVKNNGHLDISIDGVKIGSYDSSASPKALYDVPGAIGLYTEDARARFFGVTVTEIK